MSDGTIQDSRNPTSPQWGYLKVTSTDQQGPSNTGNWPPIHAPDWNQYVMFMHNKQKPGGGTEFWVAGTEVKFEFFKAKISIHKNDNPGMPNSLNRNLWVAIAEKKTGE